MFFLYGFLLGAGIITIYTIFNIEYKEDIKNDKNIQLLPLIIYPAIFVLYYFIDGSINIRLFGIIALLNIPLLIFYFLFVKSLLPEKPNKDNINTNDLSLNNDNEKSNTSQQLQELQEEINKLKIENNLLKELLQSNKQQ